MGMQGQLTKPKPGNIIVQIVQKPMYAVSTLRGLHLMKIWDRYIFLWERNSEAKKLKSPHVDFNHSLLPRTYHISKVPKTSRFWDFWGSLINPLAFCLCSPHAVNVCPLWFAVTVVTSQRVFRFCNCYLCSSSSWVYPASLLWNIAVF